ncbi:hypothetical protein DFH07DRAFT_957041 [Mycena maculata]|uniref:Uncharacterized protein n=1 Tax=Mycena maculata TaxID=230809 RepID=A0AAD7JCK7_9AGAR|nr:hypothetical protein DFH07DRAFT_957041 [Mycena maculata]
MSSRKRKAPIPTLGLLPSLQAPTWPTCTMLDADTADTGNSPFHPEACVQQMVFIILGPNIWPAGGAKLTTSQLCDGKNYPGGSRRVTGASISQIDPALVEGVARVDGGYYAYVGMLWVESGCNTLHIATLLSSLFNPLVKSDKKSVTHVRARVPDNQKFLQNLRAVLDSRSTSSADSNSCHSDTRREPELDVRVQVQPTTPAGPAHPIEAREPASYGCHTVLLRCRSAAPPN